ncbi:MAG: hypothetical protein EOO24_00770 [Comamonadaceae bacterium]|nr:MAG: hypothetical protein EOO24_00770 [Comamonadaceae bacterium]
MAALRLSGAVARPRLRALRVASPSPSSGATPTARRSRFRGEGCCSPAGCAALRVRFAFPLPGATPTARRTGSVVFNDGLGCASLGDGGRAGLIFGC